MEKIKSFSNFNSNILYVFDFDDTLAESPSFEEIALKYLKEEITVRDLLNQSIEVIETTKDHLRYENGRIYIEDPNMRYPEKSNWIRKGNRLYLITPDIFCKMEESLPTELKNISTIYDSVEDKCIVTARPESMRGRITSVIKNLGLEFPKYGLHMCPDGRKNAGMWKGEKIVELSTKYKFSQVIFYDDNAKYIKKATKVVKETKPELNFKTIKV